MLRRCLDRLPRQILKILFQNNQFRMTLLARETRGW